MRKIAIGLALLAATAGSAFGADLQSVKYRGSFALLGPWPAPDPEIRPVTYEWFSYLVAANTPIRMNGKYRPADSGLSLAGGVGGGDLDCYQVAGPVYVGNDDPNGFDADGDGIGCE